MAPGAWARSPHIAAIYGLEESAGAQFLVMELVEGGPFRRPMTVQAIPVGPPFRAALPEFLMIKPGGESESAPVPPAATSLVVVEHFDEELKRLLPSR